MSKVLRSVSRLTLAALVVMFAVSCSDKGESSKLPKTVNIGGITYNITTLSCKVAADCVAEGENAICHEGFCAVPQIEEPASCKSDDDCLPDAPVCNSFGMCEARECSPACAAGFTCVNGTCETDQVNECSPACAAGYACVNGKCEKDAEPSGCTTDTDCPVGQICNVDTKTCETKPVVACTGDSQCQTDEKCINDVCQREFACVGDTDCGNGEECLNNICVNFNKGMEKITQEPAGTKETRLSGLAKIKENMPSSISSMEGKRYDAGTKLQEKVDTAAELAALVKFGFWCENFNDSKPLKNFPENVVPSNCNAIFQINDNNRIDTLKLFTDDANLSSQQISYNLNVSAKFTQHLKKDVKLLVTTNDASQYTITKKVEFNYPAICLKGTRAYPYRKVSKQIENRCVDLLSEQTVSTISIPDTAVLGETIYLHYATSADVVLKVSSEVKGVQFKVNGSNVDKYERTGNDFFLEIILNEPDKQKIGLNFEATLKDMPEQSYKFKRYLNTQHTPEKLKFIDVAPSINNGYIYAIDENYSLYYWKKDAEQPKLNKVDGKWKSVAPGALRVCAINLEGELYCWGENRYCDLGIGIRSKVYYGNPQLINPSSDKKYTWKSIKSELNGACALTTEGKIYCWGPNHCDHEKNVCTPREVGKNITAKEIEFDSYSGACLGVIDVENEYYSTFMVNDFHQPYIYKAQTGLWKKVSSACKLHVGNCGSHPFLDEPSQAAGSVALISDDDKLYWYGEDILGKKKSASALEIATIGDKKFKDVVMVYSPVRLLAIDTDGKLFIWKGSFTNAPESLFSDKKWQKINGTGDYGIDDSGRLYKFDWISAEKNGVKVWNADISIKEVMFFKDQKPAEVLCLSGKEGERKVAPDCDGNPAL